MGVAESRQWCGRAGGGSYCNLCAAHMELALLCVLVARPVPAADDDDDDDDIAFCFVFLFMDFHWLAATSTAL